MRLIVIAIAIPCLTACPLHVLAARIHRIVMAAEVRWNALVVPGYPNRVCGVIEEPIRRYPLVREVLLSPLPVHLLAIRMGPQSVWVQLQR